MSQENVELVREGFARWNQGDYDFFFSSTAPDIELLSRFGSLTGEPYRGHRGVREWLADIQQSFERFDLWLDDVRDLGDEVLGEAPKARKQLDVRRGGIEEEVVVAFIPTGESLAHQLDVLPRHRLLPQPHGFEGFLLPASSAHSVAVDDPVAAVDHPVSASAKHLVDSPVFALERRSGDRLTLDLRREEAIPHSGQILARERLEAAPRQFHVLP